MALPEKTIKISLPYLFAGLTLLVSLSIGYGAYKTSYEQDHIDLKTLKEEVVKLREAVVKLTTQMEDLRLHQMDDGK